MQYHSFVLPFTAGLVILLGVILYKFTSWIKNLGVEDRHNMLINIFSLKSLKAIKEVFYESLLHRKIFRVNPVLGFMHMSLAFGWFLLILIGNVEASYYSTGNIDPPYVAIFFKYFDHSGNASVFFNFLMDLLLLMVLSGVLLAFIKRFRSRIFGMKKTTQLKPFDRMALYSLWLIFPLRLLAESFTAGANHLDGFLTGTLGNLFSGFLPVGQLIIPAYWAYSFALGIFFVSLPFSRYMHIPAEVLLIFTRHYGVKPVRELNGFSQMEINSCSRCGICIDKCQLSAAAGIHSVQMPYFIRSVRENAQNVHLSSNCLLCGRCEEICPVGINLTNIRLAAKKEDFNPRTVFEYLPDKKPVQSEILYFAGCMTHLTKGIKNSVLKILDAAKVNYTFMDDSNGICCGRPAMLSGDFTAFEKLKSYNLEYIKKSNAKLLITSCPICLKTFKDDYNLSIEVVHHSQYFLSLIEKRKLTLSKLNKSVAYHDPCELGRGLKIYNEPRQLLSHAVRLVKVEDEKEDALCCGGSLANSELTTIQRDLVREAAYEQLTKNKPDYLVTACPMCKRTFTKKSEIPVKDIAEVILESLPVTVDKKPQRIKETIPEEVYSTADCLYFRAVN